MLSQIHVHRKCPNQNSIPMYIIFRILLNVDPANVPHVYQEEWACHEVILQKCSQLTTCLQQGYTLLIPVAALEACDHPWPLIKLASANGVTLKAKHRDSFEPVSDIIQQIQRSDPTCTTKWWPGLSVVAHYWKILLAQNQPASGFHCCQSGGWSLPWRQSWDQQNMLMLVTERYPSVYNPVLCTTESECHLKTSSCKNCVVGLTAVIWMLCI